MDKLKINELYEQAHKIYEIPYESSVVDPTVVSFYKQKVWDRYLFAELIIQELLAKPERNWGEYQRGYSTAVLDLKRNLENIFIGMGANND